jgi:hypothetical protein
MPTPGYVPALGSSVPAALQYLQTAFQQTIKLVGDPNATTMQILIGDQQMDRENDIVLIDHEVQRQLKPAGLVGGGGKGYLWEIYEVRTLISCWTGDLDPIGMQNRAYLLLQYWENTVRQDMTLGGAVNLQAKPLTSEGGTPQYTADPGGTICEITAVTLVENRL